jgi:hypothetical protein
MVGRARMRSIGSVARRIRASMRKAAGKQAAAAAVAGATGNERRSAAAWLTTLRMEAQALVDEMGALQAVDRAQLAATRARTGLRAGGAAGHQLGH